MLNPRVLSFFIISFLSLSADADVTKVDDYGWYVGGAAAYSSTDAELKNRFSQTDNVASYAVYGGYNFTGWFGLEGVLIQTGDVSDNRDNLVKSDFMALSFTPKFTYRIMPNFSLFAKAGLAWLSYEEEYDNVILFERDTEESWSGFASSIGVGGQFDIIHGIKIRVSYNRIIGKIESNDETYYRRIPDLDAEINQVSLDMHYQF